MNTRTDKKPQVEGDNPDGDDDDDAFEIEIVDDIPEDQKPRRAEKDEPGEIPSDDDLEGYSEAVQKRIKKLTFEAREERRQREAIQREREEAVNYAKTVFDQNKRLQEQLSEGQTQVVSQAKGRVETELAQAKAAYKAAYEVGDADKLLEAQSQMIELQGRLTQLNNYRPAPRKEAEPAPKPAQVPQKAAEVQLDPMQRKWMDNNKWYGQNSEMTGFALGVHERLIRNGIDPTTETYYTEIDNAVRKRFADEFAEDVQVEVPAPPKRAPNIVAAAGRTGNGPRRVKLTSTQVALAKRLGVTPEQYAAQLLKEMKNV